MSSPSSPRYPAKVIASVLKLSERHVRNLVKEGVIPPPERGGRYDLIGSVQGYVTYLRERTMGKELARTDAHLERTRLLRAQADRTELEVSELKGLMIPAEDVAGEWQQMVGNARAKLLGLPAKAAHLVMAADTFSDAEDILRIQIQEALDELSGSGIPARKRKTANGKDMEATPKANGKRVGRPKQEAVA